MSLCRCVDSVDDDNWRVRRTASIAKNPYLSIHTLSLIKILVEYSSFAFRSITFISIGARTGSHIWIFYELRTHIHWKRLCRLCVNQSNRYNRETNPHNAHNLPFRRDKGRKEMKGVAKRNIFFYRWQEMNSSPNCLRPKLIVGSFRSRKWTVKFGRSFAFKICKWKRYTVTVTSWNVPYPSTPVPNLKFSRVNGSASSE